MNRILSAAIIYMFIQSVALIPHLRAQEIDQEKTAARPSFLIAANLWYTWWSPAWGTMRAERLLPWWHINPKVGPTVEFGISAAIRFNETWILTALLNFGEYGVTVQEYFPLPVPYKPKFESKAQRFNGDTAVGYAVNQYVSIIVGLKYRGSLARLRYIGSYAFNAGYAGPEAGFGFTLPIVSSLSFVPAASGFIMGGRERNASVAQAGCVVSGAFIYKTLSSRMALSLGGRYEYLKYMGQRDPFYIRDSDQSYGMTISVVFIF